jgi:hypothetical protein
VYGTAAKRTAVAGASPAVAAALHSGVPVRAVAAHLSGIGFTAVVARKTTAATARAAVAAVSQGTVRHVTPVTVTGVGVGVHHGLARKLTPATGTSPVVATPYRVPAVIRPVSGMSAVLSFTVVAAGKRQGVEAAPRMVAITAHTSNPPVIRGVMADRHRQGPDADSTDRPGPNANAADRGGPQTSARPRAGASMGGS